MAEVALAPCVYVLAGVNGAGRSSIAGAAFRSRGAEYFNPDEAARAIARFSPNLTQERANAAAWARGRRLLERAIAEKLSFAFETTLGGDTIPSLLGQALGSGIEVRAWYAGLASPELHIARVRARVAAGGHDIPEAKIRERYDRSRSNLVKLLPHLTELRVYDNSRDADPRAGLMPEPLLLVHMARGCVVSSCELKLVPEWAKPILAVALEARSPEAG